MSALAILLVYGQLPISWLRSYTDTVVGHLSVKSGFIMAGSSVYIYLGIRFFNRHVNSLL